MHPRFSHRCTNRIATAGRAARPSDPLAHLKTEAPGPDGIRHGLVARVRELIAAGDYDTPERWDAAEETLLARAGR